MPRMTAPIAPSLRLATPAPTVPFVDTMARLLGEGARPWLFLQKLSISNRSSLSKPSLSGS